MRIGDSYTVAGAVHTLRSLNQRDLQNRVSIVGYIVETNLARAPKCALHRTAHADPPGCVSEIPTFSIADDKAADAQPRIRVMGWASSFANVYEAYLAYQQPHASPLQDALWATDLPNPLPAVGAKVKLTGRYATSFTRSSNAVVRDEQMGIFTVERTDVLEPAAASARFPQVGLPTTR